MSRPPLLPFLDMVARVFIIGGSVLVITGERGGLVLLAIGVPWLIAGLFGLGRPRMEPIGRQGPERPPEDS